MTQVCFKCGEKEIYRHNIALLLLNNEEEKALATHYGFACGVQHVPGHWKT